MTGRLDAPFVAGGLEQPVAWRPFGEAAFAEASSSGRPLLLVIGTAWSHAGHQLDDESLADPAIGAELERFVAVRVDADDRPDLDARYQARAPGPPGWPLVCVLDPDGRTAAVFRRPSRRTFAELARGHVDRSPATDEPAPARGDPIVAGLAELRRSYTPAFGGFGPAPRPPFAPALDLLLALAPPRAGAGEALAMARRTLEAIAEGGLVDQLGGGVHREALDERWVVPRFEKRAIDQAALLGTYARAFARTGEPRLADAARGILDYALARLCDPKGGIANAEDADLGPFDDGSFYTFTAEEARAAIDARRFPEEWAVAERTWDLYGRGELAGDPTRNVLFRAASLDELARERGRSPAEVEALLGRAREKLLRARETRPRPPLDASVYVGTSAAFARACLEAAGPLGRDDARDHALRTIDRLAEEGLGEGGALRHRLGDGGELSDWLADLAQLGLAALAAHAEAGAPRHLALARRLADRLESLAAPDGGFLDRPRAVSGPGELARPIRPIRDDAAASGNALAGRLLFALARDHGDRDRLAQLDALLAALAPHAAALGPAGAGLIHLALDRTVGS